MKFVKHFYYPYYYIENFNGSIISVFFLDSTFHFEDEADLFMNKFSITTIKKSKKVIEELNNANLESKFKTLDLPLFENFFFEFFKSK